MEQIFKTYVNNTVICIRQKWIDCCMIYGSYQHGLKAYLTHSIKKTVSFCFFSRTGSLKEANTLNVNIYVQFVEEV